MPQKRVKNSTHAPRGNVFPVLATKIQTPPFRPQLVPRPDLCDRLESGLEGKLTLISAPAGFGKTTLLISWLHRSRMKAAWYAVDEGDNDPAFFLTYIIAALQAVDKNIGTAALEMLRSPQPPAMESVLSNLINDVIRAAADIALIIDDYHLVDTPEICAQTSFLLDHLPPNLHLIIATRADPALPLARLRSQNHLLELRAADLSFTREETAHLFNQNMKLGLSSREIDQLSSRTEGWIAGLQLAALSIQNRRDRAGFIQAFQGENRYIFDYLMEEVLSRQSPEIVRFLLETSILDRLSGPLCEAVTHQKKSLETLEHLEKSALFIFPLDNERRWFRYHRLFADLLRQRLQRLYPEDVPELHRRAFDWSAQHGMKEEALDHALQAHEFERAAELLKEIAEIIWDRGRQSLLLGWFQALPEEWVKSHPRLGILYARSLNMCGHQEKAEQILDQAEQTLNRQERKKPAAGKREPDQNDTFGRDNLKGRIAALRAYFAAYQGKSREIMKHARTAVELLHPRDLGWRGMAAMTLGFAHGWSGDGDMMSARFAFSEAIKVSEKSGNIYSHLFSRQCLAAIDVLQGRFQQAAETYRELLRIAEEKGLGQTGLAGSLEISLGGIFLEQDLRDEAKAFLEKGIARTEKQYDLLSLMVGRLYWIRWLLLEGDWQGAEEAVLAFEKTAESVHLPPWMLHTVSAAKALVWLAQSNQSAVNRWVEERGLGVNEELSQRREAEHMVLVRILIRQEAWEEALDLTERLVRHARAGTRVWSLVQLNVLKALAYEAGSRIPEALDAVRQSLCLAEPGGLVSVFVAEGKPMAVLMEKVWEEERRAKKDSVSGFSRAYIKRLLTAFKTRESVSHEETPPESLSERELEVLRLIATGLSNQDIADRLFISLNTVRTHTKNINAKLNVHNRTQAVAQAKALGIL